MRETGADAVMSAWALLENPAVFNEVNLDEDIYLKLRLAREYAIITEQYPTPRKWADSHYYQLLQDTFVVNFLLIVAQSLTTLVTQIQPIPRGSKTL
jgi:tRNA-dihydrouridine synthase